MTNKIVLLLLTVSSIILIGCNELQIQSKRLDRSIIVDGSDSEWQNARVYIEEANVTVGLLNDSEYLYLCLVCGDRKIQNQVMHGLTVWFDPNGGKDKKFGVHFPMSLPERDVISKENEHQNNEQSHWDRTGKITEPPMNELEIVGPGKDDRFRISIQKLEGIEAKISHSNERLVYELKVPLTTSERFPNAIGLKTEGAVSMGLETDEIDLKKMGDRNGPPEGGPMEGGAGGMAGEEGGIHGGPRMGGGRGAPPGGGEFTMPEPLKLWMEVILAF